MLKKFVCAIISLIMIIPLCGQLSFAQPYVTGGTYSAVVSGCTEARIGQTALTSSPADDMTLRVTVVAEGVDYKYNRLFMGDTDLGMIVNGTNTYEVAFSQLKQGENVFLVKLMTENGEDADKKVYGSYNIDDMKVVSVSFSLTSESIEPSAMIKYMPVVGSAGCTEQRVAYSAGMSVGDGWSAETKLGGSTPNTPIMLGYVFDNTYSASRRFSIDTTAMADGPYTVEFLDSAGNVKQTRDIIVDNTKPAIDCKFEDGLASFSVTDASAVSFTARIDGTEFNGTSYRASRLCAGQHSLYITAVDEAGNSADRVFLFNVTAAGATDGEYFTAKAVTKINAFGNRLGSADMTALRSSDEVLIPLTGSTTESVGTSVPYQAFVAETGDSKQVYVSYCGTTSDGSPILLSAYDNQNGKWVDIGTAASGTETGFVVEADGFAQDGKLRIKARPYDGGNGANTIMWISDTQYYTRYDDLNFLYEDDMKYAVDLFNNGKLAYVLHTGDLVDQTQAGDDEAHREYAIASRMQEILDNAGVPNGVVSGNHDVQHSTGNYAYYSKYFPSSRYENNIWYGGQYKNGTHHYDLITVGGYKMLFMFIGCYDETDEGFLKWADTVLKQYPDYNAVLCTHEYILPSGKWSGNRAEVIWNRLAVPNENVKLILCGHNDGVCNQWRTVEGSDRKVYEILADYQFAELNNEVQHVENGCTCDGEGFVRLLTFTPAGELSVKTYSPSFDNRNYYASYEDSFVVDLGLTPTPLSITTNSFCVGVDIQQGKNDSADISFFESNGTYTTAQKKDIRIEYDVPADTADYTFSPQKLPQQQYYSGVATTLRRGVSGELPQYYESALQLMPENASALAQTSGNTTKNIIQGDDRSFTVNHGGESVNWVTLRNNIGSTVDFDTYGRLYFSVTAPEFTKWNLYLNIAGREIGFSQVLYESFGYDGSCPQGDICGSWSGYIDLSPYLSGVQTVASVYFVIATPDRDVTFDYYFIGRGTGDSITFHTDEETGFTVETEKGSSFQAPADPFKEGYRFDGWFTDADLTNKASFPSTAQASSEYYAKFTPYTPDSSALYLNTEVDIATKTVYNNVYYVVIMIVAALAVCAAVTVFVMTKKKKKV